MVVRKLCASGKETVLFCRCRLMSSGPSCAPTGACALVWTGTNCPCVGARAAAGTGARAATGTMAPSYSGAGAAGGGAAAGSAGGPAGGAPARAGCGPVPGAAGCGPAAGSAPLSLEAPAAAGAGSSFPPPWRFRDFAGTAAWWAARAPAIQRQSASISAIQSRSASGPSWRAADELAPEKFPSLISSWYLFRVSRTFSLSSVPPVKGSLSGSFMSHTRLRQGFSTLVTWSDFPSSSGGSSLLRLWPGS